MKKISVFLFSFLVLFVSISGSSFANQVAVIGYSIQSDGDDQLYSIDLTTGAAIVIGPVGFSDVEGLSFHPSTGVLYGVDDDTDQLITIDLNTGAGTAIGPLTITMTDVGIAFDPSGHLWMSTDIPENFYSINPNTGTATLIGSQGQKVTGLASSIEGTIYGLGGDQTDNLVTINTATGFATNVGPLINVVDVHDGGIDFDAYGVLWGIEELGTIFTINRITGKATVVATTLENFEDLAIPHPYLPPVGGEILPVNMVKMVNPYLILLIVVGGTISILTKKAFSRPF